MKTLRAILAMSLTLFLGTFIPSNVIAKQASPLTLVIGTLSEYSIEAASAHREIIALNLATDTNKTTSNIENAHSFLITMVNALSAHFVYFLQQNDTYRSNTTWLDNKHSVVDFYIRTKTDLTTDLQAITTAITHALGQAHTTEAHKKQLRAIQVVLNILNVWVTKDLGNAATTRDAIIDHVGALVKLTQDLHTVSEKAQSSPSFLWRAVKATFKLAIFGFAVYGIDCATGGILSTFVAASGYDYQTAVTAVCSLGSVAHYLPAAFCGAV